eukprot:g16296.t1
MPRPRHDYEDAPPVGVSFLLVVLGAVALCVAAVYLKASTLHEREIKISAFEATISAWNTSRSTFARLSVNVTAHFGVAPPNTTSPGLDPQPLVPGPPLPLKVCETPDPIYDDEGASGGLPNYEPLKLDRGIAPLPWRTAPRFPPPEDSEEEEEAGDAVESGAEERQEDGEGGAEGQDTPDSAGTGAGADGGRRRRQHRRRRLDDGRWSGASWPADSAGAGAEEEDDGDESAGRRHEHGHGHGHGHGQRALDLDRARSIELEQKQGGQEGGASGSKGEGEGEDEEEEEEEEEEEKETLPAEFIPDVAFEDAPSVRFVFSARLEPAPRNPKNKHKGGGGRKSGGGGRERERERGRDREMRGRRLLSNRLWRRRRDATQGGGRNRNPILVEMQTEWTPLTRIREEHAPMPAPETKCMQVFGGVHNYKTKMCEVYERLSGVCVQVHVDEREGEIRFSPVAEIGGNSDSSNGTSSSGTSSGVSSADQERSEEEEEEEEEDAAKAVARYGCDPRNAWSPWSYAVVPVEGRTVLDVVPPEVSFGETLVTVRSDLDPFLHVEALTYVPANGEAATAGGGGVPVQPPEAGEGGGGGRGGRQFLTFGLSSWNCAVVGSTFLLVGLLLLLQPALALRKWWRETGGARPPQDGGGSGGGGGGRRLRGKQWRYGQLETDWAEGSDFSDGGDVVYDAPEDEVADEDGDGWGSEGDWHGEGAQIGVEMPASPAERDQLTARVPGRPSAPGSSNTGRFAQDSLRRRGDGGALGGGGGGGSGGGSRDGGVGDIQMRPMGRSLGGESALF